MANWCEFVSTKIPNHECPAGATWAEVSLAEDQLGLTLPADLKSLLMEANGVFGEYDIPLIWPLERIVEENLRIKRDEGLRSRYMPLDCLFFFADAGNGDMFAYAVVQGEVRCPDIFVWNHEDDSRRVVAASLKVFMEGWANGTITL